jgi:hypothetical protein
MAILRNDSSFYVFICIFQREANNLEQNQNALFEAECRHWFPTYTVQRENCILSKIGCTFSWLLCVLGAAGSSGVITAELTLRIMLFLYLGIARFRGASPPPPPPSRDGWTRGLEFPIV